MTKQIEGTVDDDVAAKLAIGEGRQADLEQERLELQALNSERFRHRFLERNRPWILQHLVELLTPRSLESIGPDGRPVVEYIRDVYADLMAMGEGARRPGDRSDISSDEEDELEKARQGWSRAPVQGASLEIARLWLEKARKRRAFSKLITGIIEANKDDHCHITGRTEMMGAKLVVTLATKGEVDEQAIDRLIAEFEQQYSPSEKDANLWKAFFRANAEFITLDERILDQRERQRLRKQVKQPGAGRATRPEDLSSDESDDEALFDPMVVVRTSAEGRMMSKWLGAARRKLKGEFPRPSARAQMERYAEKMRARKLKGGKKKIAGEADREEEEQKASERWIVNVNAASKALANRWLRIAQDNLSARFRKKGETLRVDVAKTLRAMPEEDDWYYGAELRIEGQRVADKGEQLHQDQRTLEAEEAVKVRKIEADYEEFERERRDELNAERSAFEAKMAESADRANMEIELRTRELERAKEEKRKDFEEAEREEKEEKGAQSTELIEKNRKEMEGIDEYIRNTQQEAEDKRAGFENEQRNFFDRQEALREQVITDRRIAAVSNIRRIRKETISRIKADETEWQGEAGRWLYTARRKTELKAREDAEAAALKKSKRRN